MSKIESVCVYCGSSGKVDAAYIEAAKSLGKLLADQNIVTVFGGGRVGLMGMVADSAMSNGGKVIGIIPDHIAEKEIAHHDLTELHVVETMHERKQMMVDRSDAFLILPGGLGTMDEFFEIFTWWQLGLHSKPIIIVNIDGYWDPLLALIDNIIDKGFARADDRTFLLVINSIEEVPSALERAPAETTEVKTKWM